jgi:AcrR family transcriptional regulator
MSVAPWRDRAIDQAQAADRTRLRSLKTVESIVSAARVLVIERRGEPFTTHELVERSGHSLQTIYRYFPSKDALLLAVFEEAIAEGTASMRAVVETVDDPVDRFRRIIDLSISELPSATLGIDAALLVSVHTQVTLLFPEEVEHAQQAYVAMVRACVGELVETGRIAPRVDLDEDARLVTYLVRSTYQALITSRGSDDRARVAAHVSRFCLAALGLFEPAA